MRPEYNLAHSNSGPGFSGRIRVLHESQGAGMSGRILARSIALVSLAFLAFPASFALAVNGSVAGNVAVVDTPGKAYGYSTYNGTWTDVTLDAMGMSRLAGDYLGYVRTPFRLYSFNSTNDHWYFSNFTGTPLGESTLGATTIFWSSNAAYAIASLWTTWRMQTWQNQEQPLGGGSCGSFALVWTPLRAYAFHSASGQWMPQTLNEGISGGITCNNFGLVWTPSAVYSFDPYPGGWVPVDLGLTDGISVTGEGNVAMAWSAEGAVAYSAVYDAWFPADNESTILDGAARGELALFWSASEAWVFDATTALWSDIELEQPGGGGGKPDEPMDIGFSVTPNPAQSDDQVYLQLPGGREWEVEVFDVAGRRVRAFRPETAGTAVQVQWDRTDDGGHRLAAGSYWVRARSEESVEVRRLLLMN
jgi:hypothetical protein